MIAIDEQAAVRQAVLAAMAEGVGGLLAARGADDGGVTTATFVRVRVRRHRAAFGFFRDRRPELYGRLTQDI